MTSATQSIPTANRTRRVTGLVWLAYGALAVVFFLGRDRADAAEHEVPEPWITDWQAAQQQAKSQNKPILAMFSASWCPPCQMMKKEVFPEQQVQAAIDPYVAVYLDEADYGELVTNNKIDAFPTFVFFNPQGDEFNRVVGGSTSADFVRSLEMNRELLTRGIELEKKLAATPNDPTLWKEKADLQNDSGKFEEALNSYQRVVDLDPENKLHARADVAFLKAVSSEQTNSPEAMEQALLAIEREYPQSTRAGDAMFIRALLRFDQGNEAEGKSMLRQYADAHPEGRYANRARAILDQLGEATTVESHAGADTATSQTASATD